MVIAGGMLWKVVHVGMDSVDGWLEIKCLLHKHINKICEQIHSYDN